MLLLVLDWFWVYYKYISSFPRGKQIFLKINIIFMFNVIKKSLTLTLLLLIFKFS